MPGNKTRLILPFSVGGPVLAAPGPPTRVQGQLGTSTSSSVTSIAVTLGAAVQVGNTLCGMVVYNGSAVTVTITDNKGNTYTKVDTNIADTGSNRGTSFFLNNIDNLPTVITASFSAAVTFTRILADEFRNVQGLDGHNGSGNGTATTAITSSTFATVVDGDLIYASWACTTGNPTVNAGTGFSLLLSGPEANVPMYSEFQVQGAHNASSAGTFVPGATATGPCLAFALKHA